MAGSSIKGTTHEFPFVQEASPTLAWRKARFLLEYDHARQAIAE
jgi:hypothetical protein